MVKLILIIKKIFHITVYLLSFFISLQLVLILLLQNPQVQTLATRLAASFLNSRFNSEIRVGEIKIGILGTFYLNELNVYDNTGAHMIGVESLELGLEGINRFSRSITFGRLKFEGVDFFVRKTTSGQPSNFSHFMAQFSPADKDTLSKEDPLQNWKIYCNDLDIRNTHFIYEDRQKKAPAKSIDFNDIELLDFSLRASGIAVLNDTVRINIKSLTFIEKSGFELKEFSGRAQMSPTGISVDQLNIMTNNSKLDLDLEFKFDDFSAFSDFITQVEFDGNFRNSQLEMSDIGYFAETMFSMKDLIRVQGRFKGWVNNIYGKNFEANFGDDTRFYGTVRMNGLPDIFETFIHADIVDFTTSAADVQSFALPGDQAGIVVPDLLMKMGAVNVQGKFTGFYNDFFSNATFESKLGKLKTNLVLKTLKKDNTLSYSGELVAIGLDAGALLEMSPQLGKTNFILNVDGQGTTLDSLSIAAKGNIHSLFFKGYDYQNITLNGNFYDLVFEGHTGIKDDNLDFTFNGLVDFKDKLPRFDFHSTINHLNFNELKLSQRDSVGILSTEMDIDFFATGIDDIKGTVRFDSTVFKDGSEHYALDSLLIESMQYEDGTSGLNLYSDFADIEIEGNYAISELGAATSKFIRNYSGNLADKFQTQQQSHKEQLISFSILLKETGALTDIFVPGLTVSPNTTVNGKFDLPGANSHLEARGEQISVTTLKIHDWHLAASSDPTGFNTGIHFGKLLVREPNVTDSVGVGIDSLNITTILHSDTLQIGADWNDLSDRNVNTGEVELYLEIGRKDYYSAGIQSARMLFDSAAWTVQPGNKIVSGSNGLFFTGLNFISDTSMLSISGGISSNPLDSLKLGFKKLNISHLDQLIMSGNYDIDAVADGSLTLVNLYDRPNMLADIQLHDLHFNGEELGMLGLKTSWEDTLSRLDIDLGIEKEGNLGTSKVMSASGAYYPAGIDRNFDISIKLENLGTGIFNPFVSEYLDIDRESLASGAMELSGNYAKPVLTGSVKLSRTQVLIKYLNTKYSAAGVVDIGENFINVNKLKIYDTRGNSADCSGHINHNYFSDFYIDVQIDNENFSALNTTFRDNELFYGTAFASGSVGITGPLNNILMEIRARTEEGTKITIPISSAVSVSENDFIIFLNSADTTETEINNYNLNVKGFTLNMDLDVTPVADIEIFLPYSMGDIKGNGHGNIGLGVNSRGDFTINGEYEISEGIFNFSFEKLLKKEFKINQGSTISWSGDPYNATVDMVATYDVNTTLAGLRLQTDSTAIRNKRIDVDCNIILKNSLFNPDISFSFDLKNVDEDTRQIIFAALDTTDQSVMSQQIISLIFIGSFSYTTAGPNFGASGFKLLSNQVSNWLSKISKDFDIGINYQPGTELTEEELAVALRTQLFDDRLSIDGNFGVRGTTQEQNTSNVVGDINLEYRITEDGRFRIKAFNRANDISFLEDNAPYTQGVGIFYRKEFETFGDLFKKNKDKKKDKNKSQTKRNERAVRNENQMEEQ